MTVAVCAAFINFISIFHLHDQNLKTICDKQLITTMLVKFIHRIFRLSFFIFSKSKIELSHVFGFYLQKNGFVYSIQ